MASSPFRAPDPAPRVGLAVRPPLVLVLLAAVFPASCGPASRDARWSVERVASSHPLEGRFPAAVANDGEALVWWWRGEGERAAVTALTVGAEGAGKPREMVHLEHPFVNWADLPSLLPTPAGGAALFVPVRRPGATGADYELRFVVLDRSLEPRGELRRLHDHRGPGEHGFATPFVLGGRVHCAWLDGRETSSASGATRLMVRTLESDGSLGPERTLDERVCDCCAPDVALTEDGAALLAYRDRDFEEVRDISILRLGPDGSAQRVFESSDGWVMPGCPVNGPAIAVHGRRALLAWYTAAPEARVMVATSDDGGVTWRRAGALPIVHPLGRADAAFAADGTPFVTYLEAGARDAAWRAARLGERGEVLEILDLAPADPGRGSGFGKVVPLGEDLLFVANEPGEPPRVRLLRLASS